MINGFAEIVKHSIIYEKNYWDEISAKPFKEIDTWKEIIDWSVEIKNYFVTEDPMDTGFRKVLNYGHTIGHAIETFSLHHDDEPLQHGEAIAIGLICESYISHKISGLPQGELDEIVHYILNNFDYYPFRSGNFDLILDVMKHDKKNTENQFNFTLLTSIGNILINQHVDASLVRESLQYYLNLQG